MVNQSYEIDRTKGFNVYLHEKDQFWPGRDMEYIGQAKPIFIPTSTEIWGNFKIVQKKNLDRESAPCVPLPNYSFTQCMMDYVASTAGCHLSWVTKGSDGSSCTTWAQVLGYQNTLNNVSKLPWLELVRVTGCRAKCSYKKFSFGKASRIQGTNQIYKLKIFGFAR